MATRTNAQQGSLISRLDRSDVRVDAPQILSQIARLKEKHSVMEVLLDAAL